MIDWLSRCLSAIKWQIFFGAVVFSYLLFQLILAFYNNLTVDDYDFLSKLQDYGFWGSIKLWYYSWQGRVGAYFFINVFILLNTYLNALVVYHLFFLIVFNGSLFLLLKQLVRRSGAIVSNMELLTGVLFFYVLFQSFTFDKTLVFWLDASIIYYLSIAIALFVNSIIFSEKNNAVYFVLVALLSMLASTFLENFSLLFFALLVLGLTISVCFPSTLFFQGTKAKFAFAIMGCVLGIAVLVLCPGLEFRQASFVRPGIFGIIKISLNSSYHFYKILLLPELGKIIFMAAPFIYWGAKLRERNFKDTANNPLLICAALLSILFTLIYFSFLVMAYGTGGIGQPRTLTPVVFLLTATLGIVYFIVGYYGKISKGIATMMTVAGLSIYFINAATDYLKVLPESIKYSQSERQRMGLIDRFALENRTDTLVLDTLYYNKHVIYRSNELAVSPDQGWNKTVKEAKKIEFELRTKYTVSYTNDVE